MVERVNEKCILEDIVVRGGGEVITSSRGNFVEVGIVVGGVREVPACWQRFVTGVVEALICRASITSRFSKKTSRR